MEIYKRIIYLLEKKFGVEKFILFEINNKRKIREIIYSKVDYDISVIDDNVRHCRAFRTSSYVDSNDFNSLCLNCEQKYEHYICLSYIIDENYSIILHIQSDTREKMDKIKKFIPTINNYFEMAKPVIENKILMAILKESTLKDPMTGLYNRRFLDEVLESNIPNRIKENYCHAFLMIDIDFFKKMNDTYGHDVGDTVIRKLATIVKKSVRNSDIPVRYGGEEFMIMLLNSTREKTLEIAKNISCEFKKEVFSTQTEIFSKTISIGIAYYDANTDDDIWSVVKCADQALYEAKNTGRDKIIEYKKKLYS